jgi:AcrR family transcriptional regulator
VSEQPAKTNRRARSRTSSRATTPRGALNRRRILDAVATTVANGGVGAVTMRAVATELEVDPMALYRHFQDKDALLAAFVDDVFSAVGTPRQTGIDGAKELAREYFRVLVAHPGLVNITLDHALGSPHQLLMGERIYRCMVDAGYAIETAVMVFSGLQRFVLGSALMYPQRTDPKDHAEWNRVRGLFRELDPEQFPTLRTANEHVPKMSQEDVFERWLDLIFDQARISTGSHEAEA